MVNNSSLLYFDTLHLNGNYIDPTTQHLLVPFSISEKQKSQVII